MNFYEAFCAERTDIERAQLEDLTENVRPGYVPDPRKLGTLKMPIIEVHVTTIRVSLYASASEKREPLDITFCSKFHLQNLLLFGAIASEKGEPGNVQGHYEKCKAHNGHALPAYHHLVDNAICEMSAYRTGRSATRAGQ